MITIEEGKFYDVSGKGEYEPHASTKVSNVMYTGIESMRSGRWHVFANLDNGRTESAILYRVRISCNSDVRIQEKNITTPRTLVKREIWKNETHSSLVNAFLEKTGSLAQKLSEPQKSSFEKILEQVK